MFFYVDVGAYCIRPRPYAIDSRIIYRLQRAYAIRPY